MATTKTTIMVADCIKVIHIGLSILAFHIIGQIKIVNGKIHKSVKFVFQVSAVRESF